MLDITNYDNHISTYGGSEIKRTYFINNKKYMVKFPDPVSKEENTISYINNQYSEYIGCKVFELFNIDVQKVELVKCKVNDKIKSIIDNIPLLTKERKEFYYKTIYFRKTEIIDKYYNLKIKK